MSYFQNIYQDSQVTPISQVAEIQPNVLGSSGIEGGLGVEVNTVMDSIVSSHVGSEVDQSPQHQAFTYPSLPTGELESHQRTSLEVTQPNASSPNHQNLERSSKVSHSDIQKVSEHGSKVEIDTAEKTTKAEERENTTVENVAVDKTSELNEAKRDPNDLAAEEVSSSDVSLGSPEEASFQALENLPTENLPAEVIDERAMTTTETIAETIVDTIATEKTKTSAAELAQEQSPEHGGQDKQLAESQALEHSTDLLAQLATEWKTQFQAEEKSSEQQSSDTQPAREQAVSKPQQTESKKVKTKPQRTQEKRQVNDAQEIANYQPSSQNRSNAAQRASSSTSPLTQVHIGQIDVVIQSPPTAIKKSSPSTRPSPAWYQKTL
ncbi:MAG: hypothetical protein ACSHX0_07805 [Akkermansiaceae bacterium]